VKPWARLRPTLLDRYVGRELLAPFGVGLLLFTFILLLDQISQLMKILVSRGADFSTVVRAFVYLLPSIFSVTIPMAFLLGVLLAFGRMASDGEIVALRASGVSPARLLRPVLAASTAALLGTFYVVAVALPAANQAYRELVFALVVSKARTGVTPRVFNDDLIPGMVIYVSDISSDSGEWKDVFIHDDRSPSKPNVILARIGRLEIDRLQRKVEIVLHTGVMHSFNAVEPTEYTRLAFEARNFPLPFEQFFPSLPLAKGDREMTLAELRAQVRDLRARGRPATETGRFMVEYHKKFAIAGACLVFGLLGLGLSLGSKKEARSAAFGLSIAIIFIYYVLIRLGEQAGDTGLLSPFIAMWGANILLGTAAVVLLILNHRQAAFDPLDPSHYTALLPRIRRQPRPRPIDLPARPRPGAVAARRPGGRPVVVLRVPRVHLPVPGILDRYVARVWMGKFLMVVIAFWALFVLVQFSDLVDDIQQNKVKGKVVLHYFTFQAPFTIHLMIPVAVLMAVLITFGVMGRRNEITAMKAGGLSVYRVALPALTLGASAALLMFGMSEYVLPPMNKVSERDFNVIKGRPPQSSDLLQRRWILGPDGSMYHYDYFEPRPDGAAVLYGLSVYAIEAKAWDLRHLLYASRASWTGVGYELERGWSRSFGEPTVFRSFPSARNNHDIEPPSYFGQEERKADTLRFAELRTHIHALETLGLDVIPLRVQLHKKVSFPIVCVVMTLIGVPFAFVVARKGALYGIASAILIAIVYWACIAIFEALGNHAALPPMLAAWAPNMLFGATGFYMMLTLET
jgi:LPS export ABC transporter permease LptF/LPS export ABC transporter permease LptG